MRRKWYLREMRRILESKLCCTPTNEPDDKKVDDDAEEFTYKTLQDKLHDSIKRRKSIYQDWSRCRCINWGLEDYIQRSKEKLIIAINNGSVNLWTKRNKRSRQKWGKTYVVLCQVNSGQQFTRYLDMATGRKRDFECIVIGAQNNAIWTNCFQLKIDKTQRNSKCSLCGDRAEKINLMINKCSKLAQKKCKTKNGWLGIWDQQEIEKEI